MKLAPSSAFSVFIIALSILFSCSTSKEKTSQQNNVSDKNPAENSYLITAPIVKKQFVNKAGRTTDHIEYYIQQSIQDYFIKFCESNISIKELNEKLENIEGDIKALQLEVEMREGDWDICDGNHEIQSRVGEYMVILKILD
jgi:hypothetical protein